METVTPQTPLQQDILDKLGRALDLVLKTAEAASAENNHKLVIQSAREVTRIAALVHKMTSTKAAPSRLGSTGGKSAGPCVPARPTASRPGPAAKPHPAAGYKGETDINPEDLLIPDLETLLSPQEMAFWQCLPDDYTKKARKEHREIQALAQEAVDFLRETDRRSGPAD